MVTKFGSSDVILHNPTASYNLVENLTNYRLYLRSYLNTLVLMCANAKMMWKTFAAVENPKEVEQESTVWYLLVALLNDKSYFLQKVQRRQFSSVGEQVTTWRMAEMQQPAPLFCMSYPSHSTHAPPQQYCCGRCCHFSFKQETKFFSAILSFKS